MRLAILMPLALTALLAFPQARADDEAESAPPKPDAANSLWEAHAEAFDLDDDGKITWEEYQKVTSGFTFFDADNDGAITKREVDALGEKLRNGVHGSHAAVFFGTPQGGFHPLFGGPRSGDADALLRLVPLLLGGHGMPGMQGMHGMLPRPPMPWMGGMGPWTGGGGWGRPGGRSWSHMEILPWLLAETHGREHPALEKAIGEILEKTLDDEDESSELGVAKTIVQMVPESMKHLAAFALVAQRADLDGDRTITREEWQAGLKAVTKDDGSLDLTTLKEGVGLHGIPLPGGDARILQALLDLDGDGKVDVKDLEGVFEKADRDGDGQVTHDELVPDGMGLFPGR